ncbi:MAG: hypothetical protein ACXABO_06925 [Promethearchaeota archaeon]|jgi:hypothetical protein
MVNKSEKIKKKINTKENLNNKIGCITKTNISSFPSLPPIIFRINKIKDNENTKKKVNNLTRRKIMDNGINKNNSKTFKIKLIP